jgi:hypothetical protein
VEGFCEHSNERSELSNCWLLKEESASWDKLASVRVENRTWDILHTCHEYSPHTTTFGHITERLSLANLSKTADAWSGGQDSKPHELYRSQVPYGYARIFIG